MHTPHVEALYRTTRGRYKPELAESTVVLLLDGCSPLGLKTLVKVKLHFVPKFKGSKPEIQSPGGSYEQASSTVDGSRKRTKRRAETPVICHECGENGHILSQCKMIEQGGKATG